jgi:hypothetical protein
MNNTSISQINSSYTEQDVFRGANSTVILFFPPNQPPRTSIKVLFHRNNTTREGVGDDRNGTTVEKSIVKECINSNGTVAIRSRLNVSDALALVDSRFTEHTIIVKDNYALGIFYPPEQVPNDFILSKQLGGTYSDPPGFNTISPASLSIDHVPVKTSAIELNKAVAPTAESTSNTIDSLKRKTSTKTVYTTVAATNKTIGIIIPTLTVTSTEFVHATISKLNHTCSLTSSTATLTLTDTIHNTSIHSRKNFTAVISGPTNARQSFSSGLHTPKSTSIHSVLAETVNNSIVNNTSGFQYPPHNSGGNLGTIFGSMFGVVSVVGVGFLVWRYFRNRNGQNQMQRNKAVELFKKYMDEDSINLPDRHPNMMDSSTQTDSIEKPEDLLKPEQMAEQTPKNWPASPYQGSPSPQPGAPSSSTQKRYKIQSYTSKYDEAVDNSNPVVQFPSDEKETVRYSMPYEHPWLMPSPPTPPPPAIPVQAKVKRMTRWESFEDPNVPGVKTHDLRHFQ